MPIKILFDYLKGGDTIEEFLNDFPSVSKVQVTKLLDLLESHVVFNNYEENFVGWKHPLPVGQTFFKIIWLYFGSRFGLGGEKNGDLIKSMLKEGF